MSNYLMTVETVKIKEFLFSTNKLKCIQGASYLLDYINTYGIRKILDKYGIKNIKLSRCDIEKCFDSNDPENTLYEKIKDDDVLYIAAGNAKFFIKDADIEKVLKVKEEIENMYEYLAPGSKIVIEYSELSEDTMWSNIVSENAKKVAIKKHLGFTLENIDLPFIEKCYLSNEDADISMNDLNDIDNLKHIIYPNLGENKYVVEQLINEVFKKIDINRLKNQIKNLCNVSKFYISRSTLLKIIFSNLSKDKNEELTFYSYIAEEYSKIDVDMTIEEYPENKSFIGFLYSDGDGLGDYIKSRTKNVKSNEEYKKFIKTFSILLDYVTKSSLLDALNRHFSQDQRKIGAFLIVGGDDVCALFSAEDAIKVNKDYVKIFESKMKKIKYDGITSSSGLLIAKASTPIHLMFEQSLVLQKNAKALRNENKDKKGYIDFQNIGSQGNTNIKSYRKELEKYKVIGRPYTSEQFEELISDIVELEKSKFPRNKLRKIYDIRVDDTLINSEKNRKILNYLLKVEDISDKIWDVNKYYNTSYKNEAIACDNILDIVELYNFINKK